MPYAIHERGFEYNDEYFEIHNTLSLHQTYSTEKEAHAARILLEREMLDEVALMQREPFAVPSMNQEDDPIYKILLEKLNKFGIAFDKITEEEMQQEYYYVDNKQLQLSQLNDEQLLDLLLTTDCNMYCITHFESLDEHCRYVLQFCHPELIEWNITSDGYLPTTFFNEGYEICNAPNLEELFTSEFFENIEPEVPLISVYQAEDEENPLLKGLLEQYDKYFDLIENEHRTELHYLGRSTQALRAVNEVLSQPYYKTHVLSYDELAELHRQTKENELNQRIYLNTAANNKRPSILQRIMKYFRS